MKLSAPRYCQVPFPPYRFLPGRHPHPTAHSDGHSYHPPDDPPAAVKYKHPDQWRESEDYLYGCDLYNHGYWWEAHEAWEGLWQLTDKGGSQGQFLQGLIQVAACHLQLQQRHLRGVTRLRSSSVGHIERALARIDEEQFMGLAVASWVEEVQSYFEMILAASPSDPAHDDRRYPYILLQRSS
jgi:hypothetical protein